MARNDDPDERWGRQLLLSLVVLLAVAGVVGGILAVVALGAARVTGLGGGSSPQAQPSLYFPTAKPTVRPQPLPAEAPSADVSTPAAQPASPTSTPTPSPSKSPKPEKQITLQAFPQQVRPGERINLTGVYQGAEGATLQVQRDDGSGWQDFPVTVSVSGGTFQTWVTTSHPGKNRFRVVDTGSGRKSNAATVTVG